MFTVVCARIELQDIHNEELSLISFILKFKLFDKGLFYVTFKIISHAMTII